MAILCFEWITTVIKYKLITRNQLWNTGAVTQESLQNSSLGKISVYFRVKKNKSTVRFFGVCAFVLSATELMKCSSNYVLYYRRRKGYAGYEITGYPCNLIGSQQCDLFLNRTIFCSKSYLFQIASFMF